VVNSVKLAQFLRPNLGNQREIWESARKTRENPLPPSIHSFPFCNWSFLKNVLRLHDSSNQQPEYGQGFFQEMHRGFGGEICCLVLYLQGNLEAAAA
jgi:hypothetical protein